VTDRDDVDRSAAPADGTGSGGAGGARKRTVEDIEEWIVAYLSRLLEVPPDRISTRVSFSRYGLDSSASILMTSELGDWLGRELDPTINYSYPTIAALARHLAE
jgi:acyl carrier protein